MCVRLLLHSRHVRAGLDIPGQCTPTGPRSTISDLPGSSHSAAALLLADCGARCGIDKASGCGECKSMQTSLAQGVGNIKYGVRGLLGAKHRMSAVPP